jgi:threonylcarbamoyladenosine tRNA methylthiotransferase MtaB
MQERVEHGGVVRAVYAPLTVGVYNLGCRVNRVELESMVDALEAAGVTVAPREEASVVVVNTCAVTAEAEAKARKAVRHAAHAPATRAVVATGCVASLFAHELDALGENILVEPDKSQVVPKVLEVLAALALEDGACECGGACEQGGGAVQGPQGEAPEDALRPGHFSAVAAPAGVAQREHAVPAAIKRARPGIKIQDGCANRCTYCIVWKARGKPSSLAASDVIAQVAAYAAAGTPEVVLTGINLGAWEGEGGEDLTYLLRRLLEETAIQRVRLSSIEPREVTDELLELMASSNGRIAPFLHMPLQAGCDATLKRMARTYDLAFYEERVRAAKEAVPGIAIATDVICGFPGETDADFEASLAACERCGFTHMHVFRYSVRPGTPAARMEQVAPEVKAARSARMRELSERMRAARAKELLGTRAQVVVEQPGWGTSSGLFEVATPASCEVGTMVELKLASVDAKSRFRGELLEK